MLIIWHLAKEQIRKGEIVFHLICVRTCVLFSYNSIQCKIYIRELMAHIFWSGKCVHLKPKVNLCNFIHTSLYGLQECSGFYIGIFSHHHTRLTFTQAKAFNQPIDLRRINPSLLCLLWSLLFIISIETMDCLFFTHFPITRVICR